MELGNPRRHLLPTNWREATCTFGPSIDELTRKAVHRTLRQTEVNLLLDPRADFSALRDWLKTYVKGRFAMFQRYRIIRRKWELRADYEGIVFSFDSITDAIYFKLAWFGNEPTV